ncbi:hypothetical protein FACS189496_2790 [Bacilli bacterium]|nr:hypothetical protein FACS189496_2790 [Bacilli bacterium]
MVDGKYDKTKPAQPGQLCGSTNQRIIDAKKTLDSNKIVLFKSK